MFYEPLAVAIDRSAPADPTRFAAAVDQIVGEMHDDGTLTKLSEKWYDGHGPDGPAVTLLLEA